MSTIVVNNILSEHVQLNDCKTHTIFDWLMNSSFACTSEMNEALLISLTNELWVIIKRNAREPRSCFGCS